MKANFVAPDFDPHELHFPFRDSVKPGESGQGYALRMAQENHLSGLPQLKKWLGKGRFSVLDSADAGLLHRWFGAARQELEFALGRLSTGNEPEHYTYAGESIGRSYFLNRGHPRVCPQCIKEDGYCHLAWDFSLVVACHRHERMLVDRCDICEVPLFWNRQNYVQCNCGGAWEQTDGGIPASSMEIQLSRWVHLCIQRRYDEVVAQVESATRHRDRPLNLTPLMTLLWPLSLNGGIQMVYALGTAAGYGLDCASGLKRPNAPMHKAQKILEMANGLAEKIARLEPVHLRISRPSVVVQLLSESACAQESVADRSLAQSILSAVFQYKKRMNWSGSSPHLSQLPLF